MKWREIRSSKQHEQEEHACAHGDSEEADARVPLERE